MSALRARGAGAQWLHFEHAPIYSAEQGSVRHGRTDEIHLAAAGREQLFDLTADPREEAIWRRCRRIAECWRAGAAGSCSGWREPKFSDGHQLIAGRTYRPLQKTSAARPTTKGGLKSVDAGIAGRLGGRRFVAAVFRERR